MLVVIDGPDGAGKRTQVTMLVDWLRKNGFAAETMAFPQYETNIAGQLIFQCLAGKHGDFLALDPRIASVLYAVDRFESKAVLDEWLKNDHVVVLDRYITANMIHQGAKIQDDSERKEFLGWLDTLEYGVFRMPKPDLVIVLDMPLDARMNLILRSTDRKRATSDTAESDVSHQLEAEKQALELVHLSNAWRRIRCTQDGRVDTLRTPEAIHAEIRTCVMDVLR